jgi:uncharacterized DUF497 family protein
MLGVQVIWDLPDDPDGNVEHIAEHGLTQEEVEDVLFDARSETTTSKSSGEKITFGETSAGRYIAVVWEHVDDNPLTLRPITAFDAPRPS